MRDSLQTRIRKLFIQPWQLASEKTNASAPMAPSPSRSAPTAPGHYSSIFKTTLLESFPPDGFSYEVSGNHQLIVDGSNAKAEKIDFKAHTVASFLTSFFGLPNRHNAEGKISLEQIAKNFIGGWDWEKNTSPSKKVLQVLGLIFGVKSLLIPAYHLVIAIVKTAFNVAGIFTEFLPAIIANSSARAMSNFIPTLMFSGQHSTKKKIGAAIAIILLGIPHYLFRAITLVGRAFTSPVKSIDMARKSGRYLGGEGKLGTLFAIIFSSLSIATTFVTWAVFLPILITVMPAAVTNFLAPVLGPIVSAFKPAFAAITQFLGPVFAPIFSAISSTFGLAISATATIIGLGAAAIATPIVSFASKVAQEASNAWRTSWLVGGFLQKLFSPVDEFLSSIKLKLSSTPGVTPTPAPSQVLIPALQAPVSPPVMAEDGYSSDLDAQLGSSFTSPADTSGPQNSSTAAAQAADPMGSPTPKRALSGTASGSPNNVFAERRAGSSEDAADSQPILGSLSCGYRSE